MSVYAILGVYDEYQVVWSLCWDELAYHNAYLAAGQVALENGEPGFYTSTFESWRTDVNIIVLHWLPISPMDTILLKGSLDRYLDELQSDGIDVNWIENSN